MTEKLSAGDKVQLKSGGPEMSVSRIWNHEGSKFADCKWFAGEELKKDSFTLEELKRVDPEGGDRPTSIKPHLF